MAMEYFGAENTLVYETYAEKFIQWLRKYNIRVFTHRDVKRITGANDPYGTLRKIKKKINITEEWIHKSETRVNTKGKKIKVPRSYKIYSYERKAAADA